MQFFYPISEIASEPPAIQFFAIPHPLRFHNHPPVPKCISPDCGNNTNAARRLALGWTSSPQNSLISINHNHERAAAPPPTASTANTTFATCPPRPGTAATGMFAHHNSKSHRSTAAHHSPTCTTPGASARTAAPADQAPIPRRACRPASRARAESGFRRRGLSSLQ